MKIKIKTNDIIADIAGGGEEFPKYTTQIMNLANQNAQGTRPKVVGKMSDLIQEFPGKTLEEWVKWYQAKNPKGIENATDKVYDMVQKLKETIGLVNRDLVKKWVRDLVLTKTFVGLRFQVSILKRVAAAKKTSYRLSSSAEESKGIDGYIGDVPVSIKPMTYKVKSSLQERIEAKIIHYDKLKSGIEISFDF